MFGKIKEKNMKNIRNYKFSFLFVGLKIASFDLPSFFKALLCYTATVQ